MRWGELAGLSRDNLDPAISGSPQRRLPPIVSGMHFHDLRHTHKTWLIEDGIPEVVQARRLGHRLPGVRGIYSHVTPGMQQRLVQALRRRWSTNRPQPEHDGLSDTPPIRTNDNQPGNTI